MALTKKQKEQRAKKAAATRARKQATALAELGIEQPKKRRRRKPLTEEQRVRAAENLVKARAARSSKGSSLDETVRELDEDHPWHPDEVKRWIKTNKLELKTISNHKDSKSSKERLEYQMLENYIKNMETYLRTGVWLDSRWGESRQHTTECICYAMAYNKDGSPKRNKGTWYPDMRSIYTGTMEDDLS